MPTEITLRQVKYFVTAVREGTIAAASQRLGVSSSAVSAGISDLETVVRTRLLVRSPRHALELTPEGRGVLGEMEAMLESAAALEGFADSADAKAPVRLGCFPPFSPRWMPTLLAEADELSPPPDIELVEVEVEDLFVQLEQGMLELLLVYDHGVPARFKKERIVGHRPHIILPERHPLAGAPTIALRALIDEPMVLLEARPEPYFEAVLADVGLTPTVARTTSDVETLRALVARGVGWSMLTGPATPGTSFEGAPYAAAEIAEPVEEVGVVLVHTNPIEGQRRVVADLCHRIITDSNLWGDRRR